MSCPPNSRPVGAAHVQLARVAAARLGPPARPDPVAHVGISGVIDSRLSQVPEVVLVLLDLLVAPRQVQRHLRHVVQNAAGAGAAADVVHLDAGRLVSLAHAGEAFGIGVFRRRRKAHVLHADLVQKQQVVIGWIGAVGSCDLDPRRIGVHRSRGAASRGEQGCRSQDGLAKLPSIGIHVRHGKLLLQEAKYSHPLTLHAFGTAGTSGYAREACSMALA